MCGCGGTLKSYKGECGYGIYCTDCDLMTCGARSYIEAKQIFQVATGILMDLEVDDEQPLP